MLLHNYRRIKTANDDMRWDCIDTSLQNTEMGKVMVKVMEMGMEMVMMKEMEIEMVRWR